MADDLSALAKDFETRSKGIQALETMVVLLNDLIAFSGNLLTLLVVWKVPRLRTVPHFFVISLAVSDILMALPAVPLCLGVMIQSHWPFGNVTCQLQGYLGITLAFASSGTLALMSLNRYYRIVKPNQYRQIFTRKSTILLLVFAWAMASLGQVPYVLAGHRFSFHPGKICCTQDVTEPFSFILVSIFGGIPMAVISLCCHRVYSAVKQHNHNRRLQAFSCHQTRTRCEDIKVARIILAMVFAYIICTSPVMIIEAIDFFRHGSYFPREVYLFYNIMACFSCSVNPIVYGVMNPTFRKEYKRLLRLPTRHRVESVDLSLSIKRRRNIRKESEQ